MAAFDFKKGLKELSNAAAATAKGLKDGATVFAEEITKDVDIPSIEDIVSGAKEFSEAAAEKAKGLAEGVTDLAGEAKDAVSGAIDSLTAEEEEVDTEALEFKVISAQSALKIIYYMMAADGEIFHNEEEKFDSVGAELDPSFADGKDGIVSECETMLAKKEDAVGYLDILKAGVDEALDASKPGADDRVPAKLLVWDLLAIAYSDERFDEAEVSLLEYIIEKINVDLAVFREMESSLLTIMDIEREIAWIKTTDKPYLTIEPIVAELEHRKSGALEGVKELIAL